MCGIIGYVGKRFCTELLLQGLEKLEYRGYDSSGISVLESGSIRTFKVSGRIAELRKVIRKAGTTDSELGIGHTRWATHGKPSQENAHPHLSNDRTYAVVHNGIIENYAELKEELLAKGYQFTSETDTEVVAILLEECAEKSVLQTIQRVVSRLKGSYALGILHAGSPDKLYCVRRSSPLLIGCGEQENWITSDATAVLQHTRKIVALADGEIACLTPETVSVFDSQLTPLKKEVMHIFGEVPVAEKNGYEHFMRKEIQEQPNTLRAALNGRLTEDSVLMPEWKLSREELQQIDRICISACGSAYHAGIFGKYILEQLLRLPVEVDVASEFRYRTPVLNERTLCIFISQSGETADTLAALREANRCGCKTLSVVNVVGSSIASESQTVLYTQAGPEIAVATTKAYSNQLILLNLIGLYLAERLDILTKETRRRLIEELKRLPNAVEQVLALESEIQKQATLCATQNEVCFIGRNLDYAVALEASLKLKEISYIHSEAYAAGELKHGTISLIEEGSLVIALLCTESIADKTISNIKEVRTRGAKVLCIVSEDLKEKAKEECDSLITIPTVEALFRPSVAVVAMQLFGYHVAKMRNCDIDKPRNLAKSVTVE